MKTILITGVNGFIGSTVAARLLDLHYEVLGIDKRDDHLGSLAANSAFRFFGADITAPSSLPPALRQAEAVVHCAALVHQASADLSRDNFFRVNHAGTQNVLDHLSPDRLKQVIFLSTVCVYGALPQRMIPDETTTPEPEDFYGESKVAAERAVMDFSERTGIPYTILRLTPVYGPAFYLNIRRRVYLPGQMAFYRVSSGDPALSLCSVLNVADVIAASLADSGFYRQIYIVKDEKDYTPEGIIRILKEAFCQTKKPVIRIPVIFPRATIGLLSLVSPRRGRYLSYKLNKLMKDAIYSGDKLRRQRTSLPWELSSTLRQK
jgi:nucleoside-diphosphate-sugar epimerase